MIRIRFVTSHDVFSWAIRGAEMGFLFSHAEAIMPDGTLLGAHMDGGVEARPWGYDAKFGPIEMIANLEAPDAQVAAFHDFLLAQIGKPYDLDAIKAFALGALDPVIKDDAAPWQNLEKWFCSELVVAALDHAGLFPGGLPFTAQHITPRDLVFAVAPLATFTKPQPAARAPAADIAARPL